MARPKFYVVWKGLKPGVYTSWEECSGQIKGVRDAAYMAFDSEAQATEAFRLGAKEGRLLKTKSFLFEETDKPELQSLSVDAACSGNPGIMEYRGVETATGRQLFHRGPFPEGTVNLGEFLAIVHGLAYLKKNNSNLPIYTDSRTAIAWVRDKQVKTKLARNPVNEELFGQIDRALNWLENNSFANPIIKWKTDIWGEIPADFGRK